MGMSIIGYWFERYLICKYRNRAAAFLGQRMLAPGALTSSSSDKGGESQKVQSTGAFPNETAFSRFTAKLLGAPAFERPVTFTLP
jgi:hypothetical protein